jgi:hypothetical protein
MIVVPLDVIKNLLTDTFWCKRVKKKEQENKSLN